MKNYITQKKKSSDKVLQRNRNTSGIILLYQHKLNKHFNKSVMSLQQAWPFGKDIS